MLCDHSTNNVIKNHSENEDRLISYHIREAVRIQVIQYDEGMDEPIVRRFSVDPQITDFSILQSIIARAFNVKSCICLWYMSRVYCTYMRLRNDWDLDCAYINSCIPYILIKMVVVDNDWDVINMQDVPTPSTFTNSLINKVEKIVSKAFSKSLAPLEVINSNPLTESQYFTYLDKDGRIRSMRELRISIYRRGVDTNLRKAVWKHLLNVYPSGLTGQQRYEYIRTKSQQYNELKSLWKENFNDPKVESIYNMVKEDVLRTDRTHSFFSGSDNPNVTSLASILTTYSLNHSLSYCQGMSDLASPLLYVMRDEGQSYLCFCALMKRVRGNFEPSGNEIIAKFNLFRRLLSYYDPEFWSYIRCNGDDLLFAYRWIILELKREFAFDDALCMLEVLWASIPPEMIDDLPLWEKGWKYEPEICKKDKKGDDSDKANGVSSDKETYLVKKSNSVNEKTIKSDLNSKNNENQIKIKKGFRNVLSSSALKESSNDKTYLRRIVKPSLSLGSNEAEENKSPKKSSQEKRFSWRFSFPPKNALNTRSWSYPRNSMMEKKFEREIKPLRTIRFLPKILSNDSREIDSPDADEKKEFNFPSRIEQQFSEDEKIGSFDSCKDLIDVSNNDVNQIPKEINSDQKNSDVSSTLSDSIKECYQDCLSSFDKDYQCPLVKQPNADWNLVMVHCNGEYVDTSPDEWLIPTGLVNSGSHDSLKNEECESSDSRNSESGNSGKICEGLSEENSGLRNSDNSRTSGSHNSPEKEKSEGYGSGSSEVHYNGNDQSNCSSCSSLIILSNEINSSNNIVNTTKNTLPSPSELGSNNAFMLFMCLSLLLAHRDKIMESHLDINEMGMYFDGYIRKHNVNDVLDSSRALFHSYLSQWHRNSFDEWNDENDLEEWKREYQETEYKSRIFKDSLVENGY